jgi:hypothetical protein
MQFLQRYEEGQAFLQQSVIGDETTMNLQANVKSMEWKHTSSPRTKKFKCAFCRQSDVDAVLVL